MFGKIYCIIIILFGVYFMLNLILAVIMSNFTKISQIENEKEVKRRQKEINLAEGKSEDDDDEFTLNLNNTDEEDNQTAKKVDHDLESSPD